MKQGYFSLESALQQQLSKSDVIFETTLTGVDPSKLKLSFKATPIYYQNYINSDSFNGYQLHVIALR